MTFGCMFGWLSAQDNVTLTGRITDDTGEELIGVNITVKGLAIGSISDIDGSYSIVVPNKKNLIMQYSFLGMETQEIKLDGKTVIDVTLIADAQSLDELVIVAFGEQKKESVLSSITTIKPSNLESGSPNLTTALQGSVAGMISYQSSGEPGEDNAEFFIRGVTTFGYKTDPLILIDGIELTTTDLARLNTDEIESFSIMKDAAATALYGARGANGVILVNTKQGVKGKTRVDVRITTSIASPTRQVEFADPISYMELHNEALKTRNPLGQEMYSKQKIERTKAGVNEYMYPATDWYNMLFNDNVINNKGNISLSGGGKKSSFYVAGSYSNENGLLKVDERNNFNSNVKLNRYSLRSNINLDLTDFTKLTVRFYGSFDDYSGPLNGASAIYNQVVNTNPVLFPAYYPEEQGAVGNSHIAFGNYDAGGYNNPYADMVKGYKEYQTSNIMAQFQLKHDFTKITKGLSARIMGNTTRKGSFTQSRSYTPFYYKAVNYDYDSNTYDLELINEESGDPTLSYTQGYPSVSNTLYLETAINYNRTFKKHATSGMLIGIVRESVASLSSNNSTNLTQSLPYRNLGLSGRFTYAYENKYLAELNFGYNGSERFSEEERWGFFPSAAIGWIASNEEWFGSLKKTVQTMKFRVSYGLAGNDAIGSASDRFFYLSNVNLNNNSRGYTTGQDYDYTRNGVSISRYENDNITWETAKILNAGIELSMFDGLDIQVEYFNQYRKNILMALSYVPATFGLQSSLKNNTGEASSEGVDMSVDYKKYFGKWWVSARANFTYAVGRYEVVDEPDYIETPWLSKEGQKLSQTYGFVAERLFIDEYDVSNSPTQFGDYGEGDIKYKDINNDGQITDMDKVPIGNPTTPEINYGFGFSTGYKNFDISAFFSGVGNRSFWVNPSKVSPFQNDEGALLKVIADSHWSEDNRDIYAFWPRLSTTPIENNIKTSTWFMQDGALLRLKTIEFGYSLPKKMTSKVGIDKLRFYGSANNLMTWSNFKLWDVEMAGNGLAYPIQRRINLGLQIGF